MARKDIYYYSVIYAYYVGFFGVFM